MVPENGTEAGKDRSAELARLAIAALEDKKAEDVRVIDIGDVSVLADYFIIASGNNRIQVQAMADEVEERLGRAGAIPKQIEGYQAGNWVLLDFGDVIIHIFDAQNRLFYDLERIWKDGTQITPDQL
ncbi:MAG: ribosome silencing factor [Lachnospiraceae bacterium]|nr:ribosome silencing factor [Lachnospiraceae bacterium]